MTTQRKTMHAGEAVAEALREEGVERVEALARTDLVFGVGLRAGAAEMSELKERAPEKNLILIGFDDAQNARYQGDDQRVADPALFLSALLERLGDYQRPRNEALIRQMAEGKAAIRRSLAAHSEQHRNDTPISPGVLMNAMNSVLGDDAVVASDVGNCQMWARTFRRIATPQSFMQQTNIYGHTYGTTFQSPNFAEIARACGAQGIRVTDPGDVEAALRQGLAATRTQPALVEVMVAEQPYPKL